MARILNVDDVPLNRKVIHGHLADSGHELVDAESGEQALELAEKNPPDLVLLDVMMPGLDGFETTRRLKAQAGEDFLPIILVTSLTDPASRREGLETGADEFLSKPVDGQELRLRVRNLLALRAKDHALRRRTTELAELNRYREEMSHLIVHDLKSPMSVIVANHDYLAMGLDNADPSFVEALHHSRAAGRRILRLLANLLDTAAFEASRLSPHHAPVDIAALLRGLAQERAPMAKLCRVAIHLVAEGPVTVLADAELLGRALENIVDNALRYTPTNGRIELRADIRGDEVEIRVGNTGQPIPADARSLVFEKFGQVTSKHGRMNLGLGLYFCRLVTEAHGGRIWVEETAELPTVFVMRLPAGR